VIGAGVRAENINVSKIVTGTQTNISFATELAEPDAGGATYGYLTLATGQADPDPAHYFAPTPWGQGPQAAPGKPVVNRAAPLPNYTQGGAQFSYDRNFTSRASVDMGAPRQVNAEAFKTGAATAVVTFRARADHTAATPLDYFLVLSVPKIQEYFDAAYDLCCSGDSNGGTYSYHRPTAATSRGAVDIYVDDLPVWSSEGVYLYPALKYGSPNDAIELAWDKPATAGTTNVYLGRLSGAQAITVTLVARADTSGVGDCGTETQGWGGNYTYERHCLYVGHGVTLSGAPAGFTLTTKVPAP
jgi:hypothetical protein